MYLLIHRDTNNNEPQETRFYDFQSIKLRCLQIAVDSSKKGGNTIEAALLNATKIANLDDSTLPFDFDYWEPVFGCRVFLTMKRYEE